MAVTVISAGDYIDNIHELWWGDYNCLEWNHSYIQWLFPIRERESNMPVQELQLHEAKVRSFFYYLYAGLENIPKGGVRVLINYSTVIIFLDLR